MLNPFHLHRSTVSHTSKKVFLAILATAALAAAASMTLRQTSPGMRADPTDRSQVALGRVVYSQYCASCHGAKLEGQPNWRKRRADGRLPAPPHDATGHTWEHPDEILFKVTKQGFAAFAGPGYQTDMIGFGDALRDEEIWAVIAYIKSTWPPELVRRREPQKP